MLPTALPGAPFSRASDRRDLKETLQIMELADGFEPTTC
jgi:hypothetical protein